MIGERAIKAFAIRVAEACRAVAESLPADIQGRQTANTLRVIAAIIDQLTKED